MQMGHRFSTDIDKHFTDRTRPVLALGGTYPASHQVRAHSHQRSQLFCPLSGVAVAMTSHGTWAVPAMRGLWIPAGVRHGLRMQGVVEMRSLYFEPGVAEKMPERCQVVSITPLMSALIHEAVGLPVQYDLDGRSGTLMRLIQYEIALLPELPLSLPIPREKTLARLCRRFLTQPNVTHEIDSWAAQLNISRRTFTRMFRRETGLSFVGWRQQACLLAALSKLASGASVTSTAFELGYENPASFTTLFKKTFGATPREYISSIT